jgi:hypothetical protein
MSKGRVHTFYRLVKAGTGHKFPGLYAVEKVQYKDNELVKSEIVHEWDLRVISEGVLARFGGQDAFDNFVIDNELEVPEEQCVIPASPRTPEEIAELSQRKLKNEYVAPSKVQK